MGHVHGSVTPISVKCNRRNLNSQCKAVEAHSKPLLWLFTVNKCAILNFQTPSLKHLDFTCFTLDSIENLYPG